jgi:predicted small lipoprotein YifL
MPCESSYDSTLAQTGNSLRMRPPARIVTVLVLGFALAATAACGRRGALERPSTEAAPAATPANPGAVNPQAPDRRFILDGLID